MFLQTMLAGTTSDQFVELLFHSDRGGWVMVGAVVVTIVAIKTVGSTIRSVARERTRREIAAFIAEGSMSPEQGEKLMKSGAKDHC